MPASECVKDIYPSLKGLSVEQFAVQSAMAEAYLCRLLGRSISGGPVVDVFSGQNRPILVLRETPVRSVEKVVYDMNGSITEYDAASGHFHWAEKGLVTLRNDGFPDHLPGWRPGVCNVAVHYTSAGLSQPEQDMLIGGVMFWQSSQNAVNPVLNGETIGEYSYSAGGGGGGSGSSAVPAFITCLIAPYRRMRAV